MLLFSAGFFAAHSVASRLDWSSCAPRRGGASIAVPVHYYQFQYCGDGKVGVFWHNYGWNGVGGFITALMPNGRTAYRRLLHKRLQ